MRSILSVVNMSNETEIDDGTLPNTTQYESNQTIGSSECGIWNEEYQIISSTVQVKIKHYKYSFKDED